MSKESRTWRIRPGSIEDRAQLRDLFRVVFGVARSEAHDTWKFDQNPAGEPVLALAVDGDRVVGQYALWPMRIRVGTQVLEAAQSLDTMTRPDYRGQGMFPRLAAASMEFAQERGIEVLFGFPNPASYPGFVNKLDWDHTGDIPGYTRVLRPSLHSRTPRWAGPVADAAATLLPKGRRAGLQITYEPNPAGLARLAAARLEANSYAVDRSESYVRWRLSPASDRNYTWILVGDPADPAGVAVWGPDPLSQRARLIELEGSDPSAMQAALAEAIRQAAAQRHSELVAMGQRPGLRPVLLRAGFLPRRGLPFIVRKLTTRVLPGNVHRHDTWTLFGSDLDTY